MIFSTFDCDYFWLAIVNHVQNRNDYSFPPHIVQKKLQQKYLLVFLGWRNFPTLNDEVHFFCLLQSNDES